MPPPSPTNESSLDATPAKCNAEPSAKSNSRGKAYKQVSHLKSGSKDLFPSTPDTKKSNGTVAPNTNESIMWGFPSTPMPPPSAIKSPAMTPLPTPNGKSGGIDELDIMICHVDFPELVSMAAKVKSLRENGNAPSEKVAGKDGPLDAAEVIGAVTRMQQQLLSSSRTDQEKQDPPKIARGQYPITDSLIDDSFSILQKEMDRCRNQTSQDMAGKIKDSGISVKYSKWQTDVLMQWMIDNKENPFPDPADVHELMGKTKLSYSQIINWTTNVRKRNRKATCEDGKKPHHFIDFLFLAEKRDASKAKATRECNTGAPPATPTRPTVTSARMQTPNSQKKRKAESMDLSPSPAQTPRRSAGHAYPRSPHPHPASPHGGPYYPEYGYDMAFPTSPAYHYGHHHYPPSGQGYVYVYAPPGQPHPGQHSPHHHIAAPYPVQYYHRPPLPPRHPTSPSPSQRKPAPPSNPPNEPGKAPELPSIREEDAESNFDNPKPKNCSETTHDGTKLAVETVKVKQEPQEESASNGVINKQEEPGLPPSAAQAKPDTVPSSSHVRIKQEECHSTTTINLVHDATALDPIDVDAIPDNNMLEAFASYWEVYIKEETEEEEEAQKDNVHEKENEEPRPDMAPSSSPNIPPRTMEKTSGGEDNSSSDKTQQWLVPSVSNDNHMEDMDPSDLDLEDLATDLGIIHV